MTQHSSPSALAQSPTAALSASSQLLWHRVIPGTVASGILLALYARGGMGALLGFVMLVPWLYGLNGCRTLAQTFLCGWAMALALTAAVFAWFGMAIGHYIGLGVPAGLLLLLLGAPLFQPQLISFAVVRHLARQRHGPLVGALAGAAAWVGSEWLLPKLLGDTLGHGLYPLTFLRQAADIGGAAGLTLLLLLSNESLALALVRRRHGLLATARPLLAAALIPLVLLAYGWRVLGNTPAAAGKPLRMGLIQSNIVDYEHRRQQQGTYQVVRKVLDTHFAMSYDAVVRQHADAVLWSETSYPTTFAHPKSEAGAQFDQSILDIVHAAGVPFVFGTYDRDVNGEYNAAAFVSPDSGLLGFYRKTRLFPLTEYVPPWMDGLRRWLPWAGSWLPGNGARVFPLRLADGREVPVLPLICRDDVDTMLAIEGTRLGAQAILTMSNDAWFTDYRQGAALHQAVAAFRSIETRLPQFRVTTNGFSGVIDANGNVSAQSRMNEPTVVMGALPVSTPPRTLMVRWGNWVGLAGLAFLILLACVALEPPVHVWLATLRASWLATPWGQRFGMGFERSAQPALPLKVAVLPPAARVAASLLRSFARISLLWIGLAILQNDALRGNTLAQIRTFIAWFLLPEAAAWCILFAFAARARIEHGTLVLTQGTRRIEIALPEIIALESWRIPLPGPGVTLRLTGGGKFAYGLALANPATLVQALAAAGSMPTQTPTTARQALYESARLAIRRGILDRPLLKFILLPLALALPAFYLHQHITYGSGLGEYTTFGLLAYCRGLALWWAAWAIGIILCGAALRVVIELATLLTLLLHPGQVMAIRHWLERLGNAALYLGLPGWLLLRVYGT